MSKRTLLRIISLIMFVIAVVFVFIAVSAPTLGTTIYIGDFVFGAKQWRTCYKIYAFVMVALFVVSFFIKDRNNKQLHMELKDEEWPQDYIDHDRQRN